jgi:translocation and assembly module TamA
MFLGTPLGSKLAVPNRASTLLAAVVAMSCASAEWPDAPGPVVANIEIRGNSAISDRELERKLATAETGWWPLARKNRLDPAEWQTDLDRIERYYETQGYYRAEVTRSEVQPRPGRRVDLVAEVAEGEPARIEAVAVRGLEELSAEEREAVRDDLPLRPDDVFFEHRFQEAQGQILRRLKDQGRAAAALVGEARVDLLGRRVNIDILADPGRVYRFGSVVVNQQRAGQVDPALVREQAELAIGTDRLYSEEALDEAQRRIFAMGVFSTARVRSGALDRSKAQVPVIVELRESPMHTVRLGGGVAIDQVRQEARLLAAWADQNFLGGLRRLGLQAVAGWAFIPNTLAVVRNRPEDAPRHGPIYRAGVDFAQPRFLGRPSLRLDALLETERTLEPAYDAIGGRGRLALPWQLNSRLTLVPSYNLQGYWLNGPATATAATAPLALGCTSDPCFVRLSFLEQTATWDRRDHPLEPRAGFFLSLSLQEGGGPLGGDFDYFRVLPEARGYWSPGPDDPLTFSARLRVGTLAPRSGRAEDSPVVARFQAGGANSMRGFGLRRLSPLLLLPVDPARPEVRVALPIGGNGLIDGSFETRARISQDLLLAAFVDVGLVTRERVPLAELDGLSWAAGLGLRYLTPVGPLRLDLGVRLPFGRPPPLYDPQGNSITYFRPPGGGTQPGRENGDNINRSCLGIGGGGASSWVRDGLCAIHISIGEAF